MTFEQLGLSGELLLAVQAKGYTTPSPIQVKAIPAVIKGQDVLAAAQTGTGKTAGFTLPLLQNLIKDHKKDNRHIRALVVTPTRELAAQVYESVKAYGKNLPFRSTAIFGGVPAGKQIALLRQGIDVLVATPGRLLDLQNQKKLDLSRVEILVLDEADRMLDMGFIHDIKRIIASVPKDRQSLLFSATFSDSIRKLATGFMNNPISIDVAPRNTAAESVEQQVYKVDKSRKPAVLTHLIKKGEWEQVLVFTRTKHGANRLAKKLFRSGITSAAIHGNKSQGARTRALREFKDGQVKVLVATDIAARGLDIEQLPWVVNFELPNVAEDYVHRIGRTGRAGLSGKAVSLVSSEEQKLLNAIERLLKKRIPIQTLVGFEPEENVRVNNAPKPQGHSRKEKSLPSRNRNKQKPREREKQATEAASSTERSDNRRKPNNQKPRGQKPKDQKSNDRKARDRKPDNNRKPNNKNSKKKKDSNNDSGDDKKNIKSVKFSSAIKKRKHGKKGPIGYGMWPLE